MALPTAPVAAGSLVGGYVAAGKLGSRAGGVAAMAGGLGYCARQWSAGQGRGTALGLAAVYLGGFGASHPLAKKIGAWPSVLGVAALSGAASYLLADRR